jgi:type IV pilus biogenesis protein CpaD/CtpE
MLTHVRLRQYTHGFVVACFMVLLSACQTHNNLALPVADAPYQLHRLTMQQGQAVIAVPVCPNTGGEQGPSAFYNNFGCSTTRNLGLMLMDPWDI